MKTRFILLFVSITTLSFSQKKVCWKGGTPGREDCWHEARNWSNNKAPDEFSDVYIPDVSSSTFHFPVIKEGVVELSALRMDSNAHLTVAPSARLVIHGYAEGLTENNLILRGELSLPSRDGPTDGLCKRTSH